MGSNLLEHNTKVATYIRDAADLNSGANFFLSNDHHPSTLRTIKESLEERFKVIAIPADQIQADAELGLLYNMALSVNGHDMISQFTLVNIMKHRDFYSDFTEPLLGLMYCFLEANKWTYDRTVTGPLRKAVVDWMNTKIPAYREENYELNFIIAQQFNYWIELLVHTKIQDKFPKFRRVFSWIAMVHIENILSGRRSAVSATMLEYIVGMLEVSKMPTLINATISAFRSFLNNVDGFSIIFPDEKIPTFEEQAKMSKLLLKFHISIFAEMINRLNTSSGSYGKENAKFSDDPKEVTLPKLLQQDSRVWSRLVWWFENIRTIVPQEDKFRELNSWKILEDFQIIARNAFVKEIDSISEGNCKSSLIYQCTGKHIQDITEAWEVAINFHRLAGSLNNFCENIYNTSQELIYLNNKCKKLQSICNELYQESGILYQLNKIVSSWKDLSVNEILYITGERDFETVPMKGIYKDKPIPKVLFSANSWLEKASKSNLFMREWKTISTEDSVAKLGEMVSYWVQLAAEFEKRTILFVKLQSFDSLITQEELKILLSTSRKVETWECANIPEEEVHQLYEDVENWRHLVSIVPVLPVILTTLRSFSHWIDPENQLSLKNAIQHVVNLSNNFPSDKWPFLILSDYKNFQDDAKFIDPCLHLHTPEIFETAQNCGELLNWLKKIPNDSDFTTSLEIAMGRSEMECPDELWQAEEGKPGRPDEQKLSMLQTVRSYFHSIIYNPKPFFGSYDSLLLVIRKMDPNNKNVLESLNVCNKLRLALMELLDDNTDDAATNRLLQLFQLKKRTKWICKSTDSSNLKDNEAGEMWLEWNVPHFDSFLTKTQNLSELMDFQSSLALSKVEEEQRELQQCISTFLQQMSWMKELLKNYNLLNKAGHFEFKNFYFEASINEEPDFIRNEVIRSEEILKAWEQQVTEERKRCYYLNCFGMKCLWKLVDILDSKTLMSDQHQDYNLRDLLKFVQPDYAKDESLVSEFTTKLEEVWKSSPHPSERSAQQTLSLVTEAVKNGLEEIKLRRRPIDHCEYVIPGFSLSEGGLYIVHAENSGKVMECLLTVYTFAQYIPENHEVIFCKNSTNSEELRNLIFRWKSASEYGLENRVYCIVNAENLSFEIQNNLTKYIREGLQTSRNPLVIISESAESQHIVAQFSHCKLNLSPFPFDVLKKMGERLSKHYDSQVEVYSSLRAGSGKTFSIMKTVQDRKYIHFPIMNSGKILQRLRSSVEKEPCLLHIDLTDTTQSDFNAIIFELIFLGCVTDGASGDFFNWDLENTKIAIELSSGNLGKKLHVLNFLPRNEVEIERKTFRATFEALKEGMGRDFDSMRYDGTTMKQLSRASESQEIKSANAFERIQYVCKALNLLDTNDGKFPSSFDVEMNRNRIIPSSRCFDLLVKYGEMEKESLTLWNLWGFVNVLHWQLKDMNDPGSPINSACIPDMEKRGDAELKTKYKAEVVRFLINTAKEFATRKLKEKDDSEIVGFHLQNFSRPDFCGFWPMQEYINDGHPVYKKGNFIFYYREKEDSWVIDDIIVDEGAVFSYSTSSDFKKPDSWLTTPGWSQHPAMKATKVKDLKGYEAEAYEIAGISNVPGQTLSTNENGVYLRQPPEDDIAGNPHYIKLPTKSDSSDRRHLFWSQKEARWQICPVCNEDQGAYALSVDKNLLTSSWRFVPSDQKERNLKFTDVTLREREEQKSRYGQVTSPFFNRKEEVELDDSDIDHDMKFFSRLTRWNDSNHECLLFSNENHNVSFLSLKPDVMKAKMNPMLLRHLEQNRIVVGEDLNHLNNRYHEILSALTEVKRTPEEAKKLLGGKFCLTGDGLIKILAVFVRIRCGIPVVLMGECGCGKTMLISYVCAWLGVELLVLDVHGGTTESDIIGIFDKAEELLNTGSSKLVYVFLDEINTCGNMGLITEVICHRSLYGRRIPENIQILAALNPYRRKPKKSGTTGLTFQLHGATQDPMADLVYRVHPVPQSLRDLVFDFGSLGAEKEIQYIRSMVADILTDCSIAEHNFISDLISNAQIYIRASEGDESATSLRDVRRCLEMIIWFRNNLITEKKDKSGGSSISRLACCVILGLAFVYYYRLGSNESRKGFWNALREKTSGWMDRKIEGFKKCHKPEVIENLLIQIQKNFCRNFQLEDGIAMNQSLMENLFVTTICILNRLPIFVVGKPGSSKTLTVQVIMSNMLGKQSTNPFWRQFPSIYSFPYQCSPLSDSQSIQHQFDMAVRYQESANDCITLLLLDEVGLAEYSPEMPLKVLHGMLVDPPIAIVGLSNWTLDPAKMNRAICLQRTEPSILDMQLTGKRIAGTEEDNSWLKSLAEAYHEIYTNQKGKEFVGMRDYYSLIKELTRELSN